MKADLLLGYRDREKRTKEEREKKHLDLVVSLETRRESGNSQVRRRKVENSSPTTTVVCSSLGEREFR